MKTHLLYTICFLSLSSLAHAYGPYDYTNPVHIKNNLYVVEQYHFNSDVENLKSGLSNAFPAGDIIYTLNAFPNHHRALNAMARLWQKHEKQHTLPVGIVDPKLVPEYWFKRAIKHYPQDGKSYHLYAVYLHKNKKYDLAKKYYLKAKDILKESAELHYHLGLLYFEQKQYDKSYQHAKKSYAGGYPLKGLKIKLVRAGKWRK